MTQRCCCHVAKLSDQVARLLSHVATLIQGICCSMWNHQVAITKFSKWCCLKKLLLIVSKMFPVLYDMSLKTKRWKPAHGNAMPKKRKRVAIMFQVLTFSMSNTGKRLVQPWNMILILIALQIDSDSVFTA